MLKMGYQGVALLIAAVIGIGFAAYQYYSQYNTAQSYEDKSNTYVYVPPPRADTSEASTSRRRRRKSEDVCSICQETLQGHLRSLVCKHTFHKHCIEQWFNESRICPICRSAA